MRFRGFSTKRFYAEKKTFSVTDLDLVKEDIINHLYTRKGERVNMPNFGTRIPELVFEPIDDDTLAVIREDISHVLSYEKRVKLIDLLIFPDPDTNSILVRLLLEYVGTGERTELSLPIRTG